MDSRIESGRALDPHVRCIDAGPADQRKRRPLGKAPVGAPATAYSHLIKQAAAIANNVQQGLDSVAER
ncbi:hypothetical protein HNR22_000998 [Micromonospora jinlongensis]|uniref:Uncharacterized protein n=1 Tax=Micromonospora jinlongensis TaxID=1287877 RepID=A0A7Y9WX99_9ACTN|nr:hypothetical protein [Micromonospora jinlongensis]NYH41271.1 hypothetical protein [Micromonospora jinlongensis]